jgi:hypothetical protein
VGEVGKALSFMTSSAISAGCHLSACYPLFPGPAAIAMPIKERSAIVFIFSSNKLIIIISYFALI